MPPWPVILLLLINLLFLNSCFANDEYDKRYNFANANKNIKLIYDFVAHIIPDYSNYNYIECGKSKTCHIEDFDKIPGAISYYNNKRLEFKKSGINSNSYIPNVQVFGYCIYDDDFFYKTGITSYRSTLEGKLYRVTSQLVDNRTYSIIGSFKNRKDAAVFERLFTLYIASVGEKWLDHKRPSISSCINFFEDKNNKMWLGYYNILKEYASKYNVKSEKFSLKSKWSFKWLKLVC